MRRMLTIGVLAFVCSASFLAEPANAETDTATRFQDTRDQGIHYFKKSRWQQAYRLLKRAYGMPKGNEDFLATFYLARASSKLLLLERAFDLGEQAKTLAKDNSRSKRRATEFVDELATLFGKVTLTAAKGETNAMGRIFFESKTGILNRKKRERFLSIRERFRSTDVTLPTTVYLPYGDYLANKVPFSIKEDTPPKNVAIYLQVQTKAKDQTWLWVGLGSAAAVAIGAGVGIYMLSQDEEAKERLRIYSIETAR